MTEKLVFWAQPLDNASPDYIEFRGDELSPDDTVRRQLAVSAVSAVVKAGTRMFEEGGVQLTVHGRQFVVEVPSAERDRTGRTAPIVCQGEYDSKRHEEFTQSVAAGISEFAERIGRKIRPNHLDLARQSFSILRKALVFEAARSRNWYRRTGSRYLSAVLSFAKRIIDKGDDEAHRPAHGSASMVAGTKVMLDVGDESKTMATGSFPSDSAARRSILVLQRHDIEKCAYERGTGQVLLDEEVYVLPFPVGAHGETPPALRNILDAGLARPGVILVQSPYDPDHYEDAWLAPQRFALAKHMYFSSLCMHLGATEVTVEQVDLQSCAGSLTFDVRGERPEVSFQLTHDAEELEKFRAEMHLCDSFEGGCPDLDAAEQLLRRTGLWSDPNMRTLLDMRRDSTNPLVTRRLTLSLSSEAKSNLKVAGRIKVPAFVKLAAEYGRVSREQYEYYLTVRVRF